LKEPSQHSGTQVSSMFAINDVRSKLYNSEPAATIFDGPAVGKALSMRSSSNYPSSIIDHLKDSRVTKSFGTSEVIKSSGTGRRVAGTPSDTVLTSGELSDSSSDSDTDDNSDQRLPAISLMSSETQNGCGSKDIALFDTQAGDQHSDEALLRRRQKKTEILSSTDSESDTEVPGCVSNKNKTSNAKSQKRRKKLTANLAGTRYDVGKKN